MLLAPIVTKLQSASTGATSIEISSTINAAQDADFPIIYLSPASESAEQSAYDNRVNQTIDCVYSVTIGADAASDAIETVRTAVMAALLGFVPAAGYDAIEYQSGDLIDISNGIIWWRDNYSVRRYVREI